VRGSGEVTSRWSREFAGNPEEKMADTARKIPYEDVDIGVVRRYANARAYASSIRQIAGQAGLGATTFYNFLHGSNPYPRTRILLCEWWLRESRVHPVGEPTELPVQVLNRPEGHLDALLVELRGDARTEARLRITTAISQGYRRMGLPIPEWLYKGR
jgi:hypothetical protein